MTVFSALMQWLYSYGDSEQRPNDRSIGDVPLLVHVAVAVLPALLSCLFSLTMPDPTSQDVVVQDGDPSSTSYKAAPLTFALICSCLQSRSPLLVTGSQ